MGRKRSQKQHLRHIRFKNRNATVGQLIESLSVLPKSAKVCLNVYDNSDCEGQTAGECFVEEVVHYPQTGMVCLLGCDSLLEVSRKEAEDDYFAETDEPEEEAGFGISVADAVLKALKKDNKDKPKKKKKPAEVVIWEEPDEEDETVLMVGEDVQIAASAS